MYNLTRQEVAEKLSISTRSVDRYVKSWKLRSKKIWKIVYINDSDVNNLDNPKNKTWEVITPSNSNNEKKENNSSEIVTNNESWVLNEIYKDLKSEIEKKDAIIQELSMRVWKSEEIAKNSMSLMDFKKSQFLLEESKWHLNNKVSNLEKDNENLQEDLKHEKNTNIILIIFTFILLIISWILWFIKI